MNIDVKMARALASDFHRGQKYGDHDYTYHLDMVASFVQHYGTHAQIIAYLHDILEDTSATYSLIQSLFGNLVADHVSLISDEPGENRKERKLNTYYKHSLIQDQDHTVLIVKAADRLANTTFSIENNSRMAATYGSEHCAFRQATYRKGLCDDIWHRLDALILSI